MHRFRLKSGLINFQRVTIKTRHFLKLLLWLNCVLKVHNESLSWKNRILKGFLSELLKCSKTSFITEKGQFLQGATFLEEHIYVQNFGKIFA